jgi:AGZA family xanthine/uracil permease-like MFS transporter
LLIGMAVTALAGVLVGLGQAPPGIVALPFVGDYDLRPVAFHMDLAGVLRWSFFPVLLTLFLMSFLDTLGTLAGLGAAGNLLDERGNFPHIERPMLVDALSCLFAGAIGTTTSGAYIESATGIREGARTGLAAATTAALFAVSLFFLPLLRPVQDLGYAYGPALIAVGVLMMSAVARIDFIDLTEGIPAVVAIALMIFSFNIANGLTAGLALYPLVKILAGRGREVHPGAYALSGLCWAYFLLGLPH